MPEFNFPQARLEDFREELSMRGLSEHTVRSYLTAVRQLFARQGELSEQALTGYKLFLMEHYKARTVIRGSGPSTAILNSENFRK